MLSLDLNSSDDDEQYDDEEDESDSQLSSDDSDSDEDTSQSSLKPFLADSDIIEKNEQRDLDERAWGKDKETYYGTNITDQQIRSKLTHTWMNT